MRLLLPSLLLPSMLLVIWIACTIVAPTPTPTPTPTPALRPDWGVVPLFVGLTNDSDGYLQPILHSTVNLPEYSVTLLVEFLEYCNKNRIYADELAIVGDCDSSMLPHSAVENVSVQTRVGADFWCRKNYRVSDDESALWGCWLRP